MDYERIQKNVLNLGIWSMVCMLLLPPLGIFLARDGKVKSHQYYQNGGKPEGRIVTGRVMCCVGFPVNIVITAVYLLSAVMIIFGQ